MAGWPSTWRKTPPSPRHRLTRPISAAWIASTATTARRISTCHPIFPWIRRLPGAPSMQPCHLSSRAPAPAPHNNDENAQDDEKDPNQKQDIADLVDVESRSMH